MKIFPKTTKFFNKLLNFSVTRTLNGKKLDIPSINGVKVGVGNEKWMSEVISKLTSLIEGKLFWDVGVNLGQTLVKLKTIDDAWTYVGFEPNPTCVYYLQELVRKNQFSNTTILPIGLYVEDGLLELETYGDDADPLGSIVRNFRESRPNSLKKWVPLLTFSALPQSLKSKKVDILKIDAEGAEFDVLSTLEPLIKRDRPYLLIEILPVYCLSNHQRLNQQNKIESYFQKNGYCLLRIRKKEGCYDCLEKIDLIGVHDKLEFCDYLVCPNEKRSRLS